MIKYERYKANTICGRTYNGSNDLETLREKSSAQTEYCSANCNGIWPKN